MIDTGLREGTLVVAVHDVVDFTVVGQVTEKLVPCAARLVIVDVREMTPALTDITPSLVEPVRTMAAKTKPLRWAFVVGRLTVRRALRQLCAGTNIGVHLSIDAALAALSPLEAATDG